MKVYILFFTGVLPFLIKSIAIPQETCTLNYSQLFLKKPITNMVFKPELFRAPKKREVSNRDDVIINLVIIQKINKYIKLVNIEKLTKIIQINIKNYISNNSFMS